MIPIKIEFTEENGVLVANATGQQPLPLESAGNDKFTFEQAGLTIQFTENKNEFTLGINGQSFPFTRDK